ncbi:zinc finger CCCH domain-containing protein 54-like [Hibiscus syriacus]|uniref:zinc finger CCCH domain-containing protein 54-like n=1 Tax=Hibiscus syriacus TaxID=106335 RepID=UPI0019236649|nr:zinc finger CCCH domain-containing protein 54-like [Hibiscus syriacus]
MLRDIVNPNVCDPAEQQAISNFDIVQAQAEAQAQAQGQALALAQARYNEAIDQEIYGSDEFRMYGYKIKRCTRMRSHDWMDCPYAHRGERAQRRDPRKYPYVAIICPAFRDGICPKGNNCKLAHGVFEYWLHPARYRTRPCEAGRFCTRKVCFFAHSLDQLRPEPKLNSPNSASKGKMLMMDATTEHYRLMMAEGSPSSSSGETSRPMQANHVVPSTPKLEGLSTLLESLRTLKLREDEARRLNNNNNSIFGGGVGVADSDLQYLDWIADLLK